MIIIFMKLSKGVKKIFLISWFIAPIVYLLHILLFIHVNTILDMFFYFFSVSSPTHLYLPQIRQFSAVNPFVTPYFCN